MRPLSVCAIMFAIALILATQPVTALPFMSIPYFTAGPFYYLHPTGIADLVILETNTSHIVADSNAALAISFVPVENSPPSQFNVAPVIAQTSSEDLVCSRTYYYKDSIFV